VKHIEGHYYNICEDEAQGRCVINEGEVSIYSGELSWKSGDALRNILGSLIHLVLPGWQTDLLTSL
jgi:hypothetical protein